MELPSAFKSRGASTNAILEGFSSLARPLPSSVLYCLNDRIPQTVPSPPNWICLTEPPWKSTSKSSQSPGEVSVQGLLEVVQRSTDGKRERCRYSRGTYPFWIRSRLAKGNRISPLDPTRSPRLYLPYHLLCKLDGEHSVDSPMPILSSNAGGSWVLPYILRMRFGKRSGVLCTVSVDEVFFCRLQ